jgi:Tfp pilus assembly protein PilF
VALFLDDGKPALRALVTQTMAAVGDRGGVPFLRERLKNEPDDVKMAILQALVDLKAEGPLPEVLACLNVAAPQVRVQAALTLGRLGWKEAVGRLKKMAESRGAEAFLAARALASLGEPAALVALLDRPPSNDRPDAIRQLGEWKIEAARPRLLELAAGDYAARWALLEMGADEKALRDALKPFVRQYTAAPQNLSAAMNLAIRLIQQDLYGPAAQILEEIARQAAHPNYPHGQLANVCHELGRYADCEAAYERWGAYAEFEDPGYLNNRAWFYCTAFQREYLRPQPALTLVREALALEPSASHIVDTHGWALHAGGRYEEAARELARSLEMRDPGDRAGRAWERTRLARSLWAAGRQAEALKQIAQALAEAPNDAKVWFEAAGFHAGAGQRDEAVHALHKAIERGFHHVAAVELNPEFGRLRKDPGFAYAVSLVKKANARLEKMLADLEAEARREIQAGVAPAGGNVQTLEGTDDVRVFPNGLFPNN